MDVDLIKNTFKNRNVMVLTLTQALAMSVTPALVFIGAIIGGQLAPQREWATLPIALMVVGTALAVYPVVTLMGRFGRRPVFMVSLLTIMLACWLIVCALHWHSFALLCVAVMLVGGSLAAIQQFRFAAMESVAMAQKPTAASAIMLAGVVAAFIGPELVLVGQSLVAVEFAGSFALLSLCYVAAASLMLFYRQPSAGEINSQKTVAVSVWALFKNPLFIVAVSCAGVGFLLMSFVMTATPISMHDHNGHSLVDTKWVIQSHVSAMFLPSLLLPFLIASIGIARVMVLGLLCYAVMVCIGLSGVALWNYWSALVFLGVGWNFLFVGATSLLPATYPVAHQYKAQAVNDSVVFSLQAIAALSSGVVLNMWGWELVLWACVPVILGQLLLMAVCYRRTKIHTAE